MKQIQITSTTHDPVFLFPDWQDYHRWLIDSPTEPHKRNWLEPYTVYTMPIIAPVGSIFTIDGISKSVARPALSFAFMSYITERRISPLRDMPYKIWVVTSNCFTVIANP